MKNTESYSSLSEVNATVNTNKRKGWKRIGKQK